MPERIQLIDVDGEVGFVLPDTVIERLGLEDGDDVVLEDIENGLRLRFDHPNEAT